MSAKVEANVVVEEACNELGIRLAELVALASFWVRPEVVAAAAGPRHPNLRRANQGLRVDGVQVEHRGQVIDGIKLDDNTYANTAFKQALGVHRLDFVGFNVCHIWPGTTYDPQCHTHLANLVGIPAPLAALSDYDAHVEACLKYRSWELYKWTPPGQVPPLRPDNYPERWRPFLPHGKAPPSNTPWAAASEPSGSSAHGVPSLSSFPAEPDHAMPAGERYEIVSRIRRWASNPGSKVHRMISLVVNAPAPLERDQLVRRVSAATGSKNAYGAVSSLLTSRGNNYGRVLIEKGGKIYLHPDVREEILSHTWD